jgi:hypothetical protein
LTDSPDVAETLPTRRAQAATVVAAVLVIGALTIGAVLLDDSGTRDLGASDRVRADGFSFAAPNGWEDNAGAATERAVLGGEIVRTYRSAGPGPARSVIAISAGPPVAAMPDGDMAALAQALVASSRAAGAPAGGQPRALTIAGQPALAIDFTSRSPAGPTSGLRVAALRDGTVYSASLTAPDARYQQDAAAFRDLLGGWAWR